MKLKNEALQKLYGIIVNSTITIAPYVDFDSPIDKAFKDCDEKLSGSVTFEQLKNLQDRNDILEKSNGILLDANLDLCTKNRDLKTRIEQLEKDLDDAKSSLEYFKASRDVQVNKVLGEKVQLQQEIDQLKKDKERLKQSRFEWAKRAVERGKKLNEANEKNQELKNQLDKANSDRMELQKDRDIWVRKNGEKQAEIAELKRKLEAREEELNAWTRKHLETTTQFDELKSQYQKLSIENKRLQDDIYGHGYDQGQTDLWEALQNVNDVKPWDISSFYPDVSSMNDIISWDMEDFLDEYKKWQEDIEKTFEQKETDRMRNWLADFCCGRVCEGCPLEESKEYKCGCGYSFRKTNPYDLRIIPDKDIKRYYETAHGCGQYTLKDAKLFATTVEGVNRAIDKACEGFCEAVKDADIKITENLRKGCTFEAEVNVNKDLFEKLCGMKSEEKKSKPGELVITTRGVTTANYTEATMNAIKEAVRKFEKSLPALDSWESTITGSIKVDDILGKANDPDHKFEYGDAVRLPWRDYDYMYVGPDKRGDGKMIRLFDPKHHSVAYVSSNEHLDIRGYKIIIGNEEDLRKIWCDKDADKE